MPPANTNKGIILMTQSLKNKSLRDDESTNRLIG